MNVNGIDPNLQAQAKQLLQSKEKVDHSREDLEVLWEYTKQTQELDLGGASDEDVIAMFDVLDTEGNTIKNALALLLNAINDGAIPKGETTPDTPVVPDTPTTPETPETPVVPDAPAVPDTPVVPDTPTVPDTPAVPDTPTTPEVPDTPVVPDTPATPEVPSTPSTPETDTPLPDANQKVFVQLFPKASQTLEIDGKSFTIDNQSKTSNNFAYYIKDGTLVIEGSDLKVSSTADDAVDNIKVMGNRNTLDMKNGDDLVEVEGDMNMIYAGEGSDFIKVRGDMNSIDLGVDSDTVWIAGNNNQAHGGDNVKLGAEDGDNFFAMGAANNLFGQEGTDAAYYNTTDAVEGMFVAGVGQEFRIEETITDGTDFENWVKGEDDIDGPPYDNPPKPLEGHEVRAYDDNTYTDKYEQTPIYYTEYRDIAYRKLDVMTTQNKETGEGTVIDYDAAGAEASKITLNPDGSVVVSSGNETINIPADDVKYHDSQGNVVENTGSLDSLLEKLATGQLFLEDPRVLPPITKVLADVAKARELYENNEDPAKEAELKAGLDAAVAALQQYVQKS